jgi:hypothetical protein
MKKVLFIALLLVGMTQYADAQVKFGLKAGVNYNSDSFGDVTNDVLNGAESRTGYHAGIWLRFKIPAIGLYLRPELVYTQLRNDVNYISPVGTTATKTDFQFSKIDVPVLLGKKIFGVGHVFAGPSFQYILDSDFGLNDLTEISTNEFSLGIQMGFGIEFGRLGIEARWERGLTKSEMRFVDNNISDSVNFDARVNQIIFGLAYRL